MPSDVRTHYVERDAKIEKLRKSGLTTPQIAARIGMTAVAVRQILFKLKKRRAASPPA